MLTEENKAPTFMTLLAAKEHVLEDYTPVREVKRIKNFLVSIEKDFRCFSERCQNIWIIAPDVVICNVYFD